MIFTQNGAQPLDPLNPDYERFPCFPAVVFVVVIDAAFVLTFLNSLKRPLNWIKFYFNVRHQRHGRSTRNPALGLDGGGEEFCNCTCLERWDSITAAACTLLG